MSGPFQIILVAGITQGIFFTILLIKNRKNRYANRFLAILSLVAILLISFPILNQTSVFFHLPIILIYIVCSPLTIAPLIFLYTKFLTHPHQRFRKKDTGHFFLFLLWFMILSILYLFSSAGIGEFLNKNHRFIMTIMWINIGQTISYHIYILYRLGEYSKSIKQSFSSIEMISLGWLKTMIGIGLFFGLIMLFVMIAGPAFKFQTFEAGKWIILAMVAAMFVISYLAIRQPEIFQLAIETRDFKKKYRTSGMSSQKSEELKQQVLDLMKNDKPFLNNLLSISDLALRLHAPIWYVSQVINEGFQMNFFDFINQYRVEEAKTLLSDSSKDHKTILEIAYEAGFNSKSTFNTAFKKYLKMTPSQFRKHISGKSA